MADSSQAELLKTQVIKIDKAGILKNQKIHDRNSTEDVMIAVDYLAKVMDKLRVALGRQPYRNEILAEMKRIGFDISKATLWRYRGKIKKVQTAVRDLLEEGTYSAYFDHNMELLDDIEEYSLQCYFKTWTNSKIEQLVTPKEAKKALEEKRNPRGVVIKHTSTGELASGKAAFLNILAKVVELRRDALSNENINLASALLSEDFALLKEKFEESQRKLIEAEKELKAVLRKKRHEPPFSND